MHRRPFYMLKKLMAFAVLITAGCSTTPTPYKPQDSYALNIARAAGIDAKLKDTELPKDTVSDITDSSGFCSQQYDCLDAGKHRPEFPQGDSGRPAFGRSQQRCARLGLHACSGNCQRRYRQNRHWNLHDRSQ